MKMIYIVTIKQQEVTSCDQSNCVIACPYIMSASDTGHDIRSGLLENASFIVHHYNESSLCMHKLTKLLFELKVCSGSLAAT